MASRITTVSREISARPQTVWALLTNAESYSGWNPAVISIEGQIEDGESIDLVSIVNPDRSFNLSVEMHGAHSMTWSDGMPLGLFKGVRVFELTDQGESTTFEMTETYSGVMAGLITKAIPDMQDSFEQFADGLKAASEAAESG